MTAIEKAIRVLASLSVAALVCGCKKIECDQYSVYVHDENAYKVLVDWADKEVFSRRFEKEDFSVVGFVGPGRSGAFLIDHAGISLPDDLAGYELRPIGPDHLEPAGIFIGSSAFRGLFISRASMSEMLQAAGYSEDGLEEKSERVATICADSR